VSRSYSDKTIKLVWGLSAARCCYPDCRVECVAEATKADAAAVLGKIAHIVGHSDNGPRSDPNMSKEERDDYPNLILLCGTHHDLVDGQPNTYTVNDLRTWKADHENWVKDSLADEMPQVGFAELEVTSKALLSKQSDPTSTFTVTPPADKMAKNLLTGRVHLLLQMGLANAREVEHFIQSMADMDPDFPERLKAGFVEQYEELRQQGYEGDALFEGLREFAAGGSRDFRRGAAGLAVLGYLFEKCEVFES